MTRIVFSLIAVMLLIPLLYVIFFTPFIPFLLRQLKIGRSSGNVRVHANDADQDPDVIIPDEIIKPSKKK